MKADMIQMIAFVGAILITGGIISFVIGCLGALNDFNSGPAKAGLLIGAAAIIIGYGIIQLLVQGG